MSALSKTELAQAEKLAALTWANPFTESRNGLIRDLLDLGQGAIEEKEVGYQIAEMAQDFLVRNSGIAGKQSAPAQLRTLYQDIAFLSLYYDFIADFDKLIESAHERGSASQRVTFYKRFCDAVERWFPRGFYGEFEGVAIKRLFGVYFQVRRASYHIRTYIVGNSRAIASLRARIWQSIFTHNMQRYQRVLANRMGDVITLITGASGTGKELVARSIGYSRFIVFDTTRLVFEDDFLRAFFPINLTALSPTLLESELFGHRKGAFTGALQDRKGYLEMCGCYGTVFLDEIGEIEPTIQVKLLRLLQTRVFQRIGDTEPIRFEGKIMAATNRDLVREIKADRFREDFYFRLNADRIETPALIDIIATNKKEISYLVRFIAVKLAGEREGRGLAQEVYQWVDSHLKIGYTWPGNFRELEQCVKNIMIHGEYHPEDLREPSMGLDEYMQSIKDELLTADELMAGYVKRVYQTIQNYEEVGRKLGLDRRTVKKYVMKG